MSNLACFLEEIFGLEAKDMECIDMAKSDEDLEPQDERQKVEKLQESHLFLKKKLSLSHELIGQYNDKIKECQQVSTELEIVKDNLKKVNIQFKTSLAKITQLELENEDYKKKIANYSKIVPKQQTMIAANQQHLQQLIFKVQELEHKEVEAAKLKKNDPLKEKIKTLEAELKALKDSHKSEITQMEIKLKNIKADKVVKNHTKMKQAKITHDNATCTGNKLEPVMARPETAEKCIMTNEFYSIKDDPYPLFCSKCITKLDSAPLDQIFKHMSACPTMITKIKSPTKESDDNNRPRKSHPYPLEENELTRNNTNSDICKSDFKRLEKKICLLEQQLHKKVKIGTDWDRNPCCGFQYPNNCYSGLYQNFFQPRPMIRSQSDMFRFQSWQENLRGQKRSRRAKSSLQKLKGMKFRTKRKLDDGTSEWNVDPVPGEELIDSDHTSAPENSLNLPLRTESRFHISRKKASKCRKESESPPPLRRKKKDKLATLFSPLHSPLPKLPDDMDEETCREISTEESRVSPSRNEVFGDQEAVPRSLPSPEQTVEYEQIECAKSRRGKPRKNVSRAAAKQSLVTKIRNLKKNCNKIKPLVAKIVSTNNNTNNIASDHIAAATVQINKLRESVDCNEPIQNRQCSNDVDDYCLVKKHRIAHNARKLETDILGEANKTSVDEEKAGFVVHFSEDCAEKTTQNETIAIIEKSDIHENKIETVECNKNPTSAFQIEQKSNLRDADAVCSQLVKRLAVKNFEVKTVAKVTRTETDKITNGSSIVSLSVPNKAPHAERIDLSLQPCVKIPRMHLDIQGVKDSCKLIDKAEENESNIGPNIDEDFCQDPMLRILRSKAKIIKSGDKASLTVDTLDTSENIIGKSCAQKIEMELEMHPSESLDNETSNVHDTSMSVESDKSEDVNNEVLEIDKTTTTIANQKYKRTRVIAPHASPMRELRSRRIMLSLPSNLEGNISIKDKGDEKSNETPSSVSESTENFIDQCSEGFGPDTLIKRLLIERFSSENQYPCNKKRFNEKLKARRENLVIEELTKLTDDSEWSKATLLSGIERFSKLKTHTIAKCTIDFLVTKAMGNEGLDKSYTPPAPLLSKSQQRVLTMLVVLNRTRPDIIKLVQTGIEFKLFRLGHAPEVDVIKELTRVYTALARIQKDRERVRIFCCDAIYCLGLKAMPLIYVTLVSWPEVFPMAGTSNDPLILCLVNSIMTQTGDTGFPNFFALKKLLTGYYNYESCGYATDVFAKNLITALKEKRENGLDTAIILLAKKKGPQWTHHNIIQAGLLPMIIQKSHPSIYDAFCLLGHLMRSFPIDDKDGSVQNILEQLRTLMESGEGSMQQQEGVAIALLSLFRHKPQFVARTILNWKPNEPLSQSTSRQLTVLFNNHRPSFWTKLLGPNCKKITQTNCKK